MKKKSRSGEKRLLSRQQMKFSADDGAAENQKERKRISIVAIPSYASRRAEHQDGKGLNKKQTTRVSCKNSRRRNSRTPERKANDEKDCVLNPIAVKCYAETGKTTKNTKTTHKKSEGVMTQRMRKEA